MIKTKEEISIIRRAAKAAESVFVRTLPFIRTGMAERELAEIMEAFALEIPGVTGLAFPPIIASGPNGADPHAPLTDRLFEKGDFVTVDFGVMLEGYASDMTRTFVLGAASKEQRRVYKSVQRAQAAGLKAARAGIACAALDAVCRDIITEDGYGDNFIHTTGHGLGKEVHEDPRLGKTSEVFLEADMVVTIEPGIYIEGTMGVRIEDTVLITENGCEILTPGVPKRLVPIKPG